MKFLFLTLPALILTLGLTALLSTGPVEAAGGCPGVTGWQYDVTRAADTCDQAKNILRSYLENLAHQSCSDLYSYSIVIEPTCTTNICGQKVAKGDLYMCCIEP
ncbi:MAG: hypothetical protein QNK37_09485 [Acidobacteriota bacterium]|nr:hypothetical protein [Acidobacteriota bacterium]